MRVASCTGRSASSGVEGDVLSLRPYTFGMPFQGVDDVGDVLLEILYSVHRRSALVARLLATSHIFSHIHGLGL